MADTQIRPTNEQIAIWEARRTAEIEARKQPYIYASRQRVTTADIAAEHDELIAEILYEITLSDIGI